MVHSGPPAGTQPSEPGDGRSQGAAVELDGVVPRVDAMAGGEAGVPGVSLRIPPGQSVALVSQPRDAATALFDVISGLARPRAGRLRVDGLAVHRLGGAELNRYRAHRGLISPRFPLLPSLSVADNVLAAPPGPPGRPGGPAAQRASRLLELAGAATLAGPAQRLPPEDQWRVMIARALMPSPRLVLAEDPAPGLDAQAADRILDVLVDVHAMLGFTLVLVAGRPASAVRCQRRVLLAHGAVTEDELTGGDDPWTRSRVDRIG
ncbi:MAG TPA: ATP-binding cassette domain-containing protein [Trebonia sp.]|nr:ATP-binding cassette domain-containing protein [Trebonia sp.]